MERTHPNGYQSNKMVMKSKMSEKNEEKINKTKKITVNVVNWLLVTSKS